MIAGKKVILREIEPEDIEWLREQRNKHEMRKYFREWKDISQDQQKKWYASRGNNSDPNHVYFKVLARDFKVSESTIPAHLVGCCGLHYIDWRMRSAEFGVFLSEEARGIGVGKETLLLLFDYGFKEMNLHKIWCEVYDNNTSVELYRKLGFVDEGILRDNYFSEGKYGNSHVLSVLEDEWRVKHGPAPLWEVEGI